MPEKAGFGEGAGYVAPWEYPTSVADPAFLEDTWVM